MEKVCLLCGKKFKTDKRHPYKNYCSTYCNKKHSREMHREEIREKKAVDHKKRLETETLEEREERKRKSRENRKRYYRRHPNLERSRSRERYHSLQGQKYYKERYSKPEIKAKNELSSRKSWLKKTPEERIEIAHKSYDKHRTERIKYTLERRKKPEYRNKYRSYARKYQRKKRGYDSQLTREQEEYIRKRDGNRCAYCF